MKNPKQTQIANLLPSLASFNLSLPENSYVNGGFSIGIGNRTLTGLGLLTLVTLYFLLKKRRK